MEKTFGPYGKRIDIDKARKLDIVYPDYKVHPIYKDYLINIHDVGYKEGLEMLTEVYENPDEKTADFKNTPSTAAVLMGMRLADLL